MCAPAPSIALRMEGIRRSFPVGLGLRRKEVLHGIDLTLEQGATLGLVGPNGSGKTTLLRLCAGVDRPSAGRLEVLGGSPLGTRVRRRLAYLPEDSPFPAELSARSVMELIGSLHGLGRGAIRARAGELLERVALGDVARTPLRRYSRGMLRRFGLAQAFLTDPELVLLDEPTAGLDAMGFSALEGLLDRARERGATVVLASHLISDVHDHCRQLAVLIDGRLAAKGTPAELCAVDGRVRLEVDGLDEGALAGLADWIEGQGGHLVDRRPGGLSLLELYRLHGEGGGGGGDGHG